MSFVLRSASTKLTAAHSARIASPLARPYAVVQIGRVPPHCGTRGLHRCCVASLRPVMQTSPRSSDVDPVQTVHESTSGVPPCASTQEPGTASSSSLDPLAHASAHSAAAAVSSSSSAAQDADSAAHSMSSPSSAPLISDAGAAARPVSVPSTEPKPCTGLQPMLAAQATQAATATSQPVNQSAPGQKSGPSVEQCGKLWALAILCASYVHCAAVTCSIPVLMPMISDNLQLSDFQSAMLTTGQAYIYALALLPMGVIGDRMNRPQLLALGVTAWSILATVAGHATSFGDLMLARVGLATAQSAQNVVSFSMVPDLFPNNKATAMAFYNTAIYIGRGIMYKLVDSSVDASHTLPAMSVPFPMDGAGNLLVPLDKLDLRLVQLVYVAGDMAAIRALEPLNDAITTTTSELTGVVAGDAWRTVMGWLALPGAILAGAILMSVPEPRQMAGRSTGSTLGPWQLPFGLRMPTLPWLPGSNADKGESSTNAAVAASGATIDVTSTATGSAAGTATATATTALQPKAAPQDFLKLFQNRVFMATTCAASMNDVASYMLIAWQSQFYERCLHLSADEYAPVLATLLPAAGIVGGVGGGLLADRLGQRGMRWLVTAGASLMSAPFIYESIYGESATQSFVALGIGFALSEAWRAPSSVIARNAVPQNMQATAMSVYLCIRNLVGGLGPLAVAQLASRWDLYHAMVLLPITYLMSGAIFVVAEHAAADVARQKALEQSKAAA